MDFEKVLEMMMEENNCEWWEIIDGELFGELENRCGDCEGFDEWVNQMVADL